MQSNIQYNAMLLFFSHLSTLTCWWSYCYIVLVFYQLWVLFLSCIRRRLDVPALSDVTLTEIFLGRFFLLQTMDIIYGVFRCKIFNLFIFTGRWPSLWHWHWGPLSLRQTHGKNLSLSQNTRWGPLFMSMHFDDDDDDHHRHHHDSRHHHRHHYDDGDEQQVERFTCRCTVVRKKSS